MSRLIFIFIILVSSLFAQSWQFEKHLTLHKDQFYTVYVTRNGVKKLFYFRWTLNKNNGIVIHYSYDRFTNQFVMYKDMYKDIFKQELFPKEPSELMPPYLMLKYEDFNYEAKGDKPKGTANFSIYVKDLLGDVVVENIADVKEIIQQEVLNDNKDKKQDKK